MWQWGGDGGKIWILILKEDTQNSSGSAVALHETGLVFLPEVFSPEVSHWNESRASGDQDQASAEPDLIISPSPYRRTPCHATVREPECMSLWTRHYVKHNNNLKHMQLQQLKRPNVFFHSLSFRFLRLFVLFFSYSFMFICTYPTYRYWWTSTRKHISTQTSLSIPNLYLTTWRSPLTDSMPTYFAMPSGRGLKGIWNCLP